MTEGYGGDNPFFESTPQTSISDDEESPPGSSMSDSHILISFSCVHISCSSPSLSQTDSTGYKFQFKKKQLVQ